MLDWSHLPLEEGPGFLRDWKPTRRSRHVQCEQESCMARAEFQWGSPQTTQDQNTIKQALSRKSRGGVEEAARKHSWLDLSQKREKRRGHGRELSLPCSGTLLGILVNPRDACQSVCFPEESESQSLHRVQLGS